jgi:hypothetical protein
LHSTITIEPTCISGYWYSIVQARTAIGKD